MYINSGDYFFKQNTATFMNTNVLGLSTGSTMGSVWSFGNISAGGYYNPFSFSPISINSGISNGFSFGAGCATDNFWQNWANKYIRPYITGFTQPASNSGLNFNSGMPSLTSSSGFSPLFNFNACVGLTPNSATNNAASLFGMNSLFTVPQFGVSSGSGAASTGGNISGNNSTNSNSLSVNRAQNMSKPLTGQNYSLSLTTTNKNELARIQNIFNKNKAKYDKVAAATGVPAELICAIHYRESSCDFGTYLHNGQKLGRRTTIVPKGLLFYDWTEAAIHAIKSQSAHKKVKSNDLTSQLDFAERYNGLGYRKRGVASPYVWAGTNKYSGGMYVADGKYSSSARDKRVGVAAILDRLYA